MNLTPADLFQNNLKVAFPEIFLALATILLLLYCVVYNASRYHRFPVMTLITGRVSLQILFITFLLLIVGDSSYSWNAAWANINHFSPSSSFTIFDNLLIFDDLGLFVKSIVIFSAFTSVAIAIGYNSLRRIFSFEYTILLLFSTFSLLLLISSYDLISLYLAIELQSLSFYVLAASRGWNDEYSAEAGLKYFVLGALSSGLLLFGESLIYGSTGITNFEELAKLLAPGTSLLNTEHYLFHCSPSNNDVLVPISLYDASLWHGAVLIGLLLMLVAFLFKIGAVPFHMWLPDVYEGSPSSITAFFSITPKIAVLALTLRLFTHTFYDSFFLWQQFFIFSALLSMFVGTLGAIGQDKIKRIFAYSSIAHVGYLLLGLATGTIEAVESLLLYIVVYILMIINVFGVLLAGLIRESYKATREQPFVLPISPMKKDIKALVETDNESYLTSKYAYDHVISAQNNKVYISGTTTNVVSSCGHNYLSIALPCTFYVTPSLRHHNCINISTLDVSLQTGIAPVTSFSLSRPPLQHVKYITDLSSLSKINPILAATLATILFSNAGVPPLAGFYGKLNVFLAAVEGSLYLSALVGILCSVIGAFYSIRIVKTLYFHYTNNSLSYIGLKRPFLQNILRLEPICSENAIILGLTFFFTLFFFIHPSFLFLLTHSAALSLCAAG